MGSFNWAGVLHGQERWSLDAADALEWLRSLPDNSVDLWVTSPPYEDARRYGKVGFKLKGQAWVDWYVPFVVEMVRTCRGPTMVNVAGKVKKGVYSGVDQLLCADLLRNHGITQGAQPYAWCRPGIAGSGSKKLHRRNWEPVYLFIDPAKAGRGVPWSNNTEYGQPPRWGPGGAMSHRLTSGERVNQWGRGSKGGRSRRPDGSRQHGDRPSHREYTVGDNRRPDGNMKRTKRVTVRDGDETVEQEYKPPPIANPGNVFHTKNGGNAMGHRLAHESEAPMNLEVPERFVRWFCPPDGIAGDPMCGSGTTLHAALKHGRRAIGCDARDGKGGADTARRRLESVQQVF
jgi:hypothetical protein